MIARVPESGESARAEIFGMDEKTFRAFYAQTASRLWAYLSRVSGDPTLADDLLQETYYRFLRAERPEMNEAHRNNYLFRIATNLLYDHFRRPKRQHVHLAEMPTDERMAEKVHARADLGRLLGQLKPRERQLLWLAFVEGLSHEEIAELMGLEAQSIRLLLFRARRKLADRLRNKGSGGRVLYERTL